MVPVVKNLPANARDVRDVNLIPAQEDPLEKKMATQSSIPAWEIPWTEEAGRATVRGVTKNQTRLSSCTNNNKNEIGFPVEMRFFTTVHI